MKMKNLCPHIQFRRSILIVVAGNILLPLIMMFSCKPVEPSPLFAATNIYLWVRDSQGNNMLDSAIFNYFKESDIRIYYLINGEKKEAFTPSYDAPRDFKIYKNSGNNEYFMVFSAGQGIAFPGYDKNGDITLTALIQWKENLQDTLVLNQATVKPAGYRVKINYNGVLKFDSDTSQSINWGDGIFPVLIQVIK